MQGPDANLYETDFVRWAEQQAEALRHAGEAGVNVPVDWMNVADEMEGLARSDRRELRSRLRTIIEHLLKLQCSPASNPRASWQKTIARERDEVESLLDGNRTLRSEVEQFISAKSAGIVAEVVDELKERGDLSPAVHAKLQEPVYTSEQVLGPWLPPEPD